MSNSTIDPNPASRPGAARQDSLNEGDEAAPGTVGTGEDVCPQCHGSGVAAAGQPCPACGGTGKITEGIGGG